MKRREFIGLFGGTAAVVASRARVSSAQPADRMRRIAVLSGLAEDDPEARRRVVSFEKGLRDLGWIKGKNLRIEYRWAGDGSLLRGHAAELAAIKPELILANSTPVATALREATRTVPVVFVQVTDPVGQGLVVSFKEPGGNFTGITNFEYSIGGKWIETIKELAPNVVRVGLVFNPDTAPFAPLFVRPVELSAASLAMAATPAAARNATELERAIEAFAREPNGGLLVLPDVSAVNHRNEIIALAARHRLPAIYPYRFFAASGGLLSYGSDVADVYRRAASYVDRILRGASPAQLPVEAPTRFELVINLKTAKTLGLDVSPRLVALADDVIE